MLPARTRIFRFQPLTPQPKELAITESSFVCLKFSKVEARGIGGRARLDCLWFVKNNQLCKGGS